MRTLNTENLRKIIESGGVFFKENPSSFVFTCPRCGKKDRLVIHKAEGFWCCYKCKDEGFKGRPEYALKELYGLDLPYLRRELYGEGPSIAKVFIENNIQWWDAEVTPPPEEVLQEVAWNPAFVDARENHYAMAYLDSRCITVQDVVDYGIKFNPTWGTVVFPVQLDGKLYGWQERSIKDNFKYTTKGLKRERLIMFGDRLKGPEHAIITEGPVDAIKAGLCGGNVCTMGKAVSDRQLELITEGKKRIYIGLDPDAGNEIYRLGSKLMSDFEVYLLHPPKGRKDLGDCTQYEVLEQFKNAPKFFGQRFFNIKRR